VSCYQATWAPVPPARRRARAAGRAPQGVAGEGQDARANGRAGAQAAAAALAPRARPAAARGGQAQQARRERAQRERCCLARGAVRGRQQLQQRAEAGIRHLGCAGPWRGQVSLSAPSAGARHPGGPVAPGKAQELR